MQPRWQMETEEDMKKLNVFFLAAWYPAGPMRYLSEAFERLGHIVFRIGPEYKDHGNIQWFNHVRVDVPLSRQMRQWDVRSMLSLGDKRPDIFIYSEETYTTDIIPQTEVPSALILFDLHPHSYNRYEAWSNTISLTGQPYGIRGHTLPEICPGWKYFAPASAPWVHLYNNQKRETEFALMATPYTFRPILCDRLINMGFSVKNGIVNTEEYVDIYNTSLTSFVNASGQEEVKWRWAEHAAMGCINICDHTRLYDQLGARPWKHYVPVSRVLQPEVNEEWPSAELIAHRIRLLKEEPDLANLIRAQARSLVNDRHTYYHRAIDILDDLGFRDEATNARSRWAERREELFH